LSGCWWGGVTDLNAGRALLDLARSERSLDRLDRLGTGFARDERLLDFARDERFKRLLLLLLYEAEEQVADLGAPGAAFGEFVGEHAIDGVLLRGRERAVIAQRAERAFFVAVEIVRRGELGAPFAPGVLPDIVGDVVRKLRKLRW
jgi:hypothetical protein